MSRVSPGDRIEKKVLITAEMVSSFVGLSGDKNPIHVDEEYAKASPFKQKIVPGILVAGFISAVIANDLPGPGTIYLNQNLNFVKPVYIGSYITVEVSIDSIRDDKPIAVLTTNCYSGNELVIKGSAVVKIDKRRT